MQPVAAMLKPTSRRESKQDFQNSSSQADAEEWKDRKLTEGTAHLGQMSSEQKDPLREAAEP